MEKLKPCPFCGADAELKLVDGLYWVQCGGMECRVTSCTDGINDDEEAIKWWNTRPTEPEVECCNCGKPVKSLDINALCSECVNLPSARGK